jgi:hypothetical protein
MYFNYTKGYARIAIGNKENTSGKTNRRRISPKILEEKSS